MLYCSCVALKLCCNENIKQKIIIWIYDTWMTCIHAAIIYHTKKPKLFPEPLIKKSWSVNYVCYIKRWIKLTLTITTEANWIKLTIPYITFCSLVKNLWHSLNTLDSWFITFMFDTLLSYGDRWKATQTTIQVQHGGELRKKPCYFTAGLNWI